MAFHKKMANALIGIVLIIVGLWLSLDFILKFAAAAIGLILIIVGMSFLMRR